MPRSIKVYTTGAGSYTLVFCSECGPVAVHEGTDAYQIGVDHLKTHGCEPTTLPPPQ